MDKKTKQITIKMNINLSLKTSRLDLGVKKTWVITILVCAIKILALYLKYHLS